MNPELFTLLLMLVAFTCFRIGMWLASPGPSKTRAIDSASLVRVLKRDRTHRN